MEQRRLPPTSPWILSDAENARNDRSRTAQAGAANPTETTRLLFTAYADIHAVIDAINQGHVFRYVAKPWEAEELESVIRQAVERHDMIIEKNLLLAEPLQTANAKLTEANRLKGVFLEVASHELNAPVSVVLGLTDLWKPPCPMTLPGRSGSGSNASTPQLGALARTVQRMFKLVDNKEFGRTLEF